MPLLTESELILNPDGSVYHLNLKPGDIANDIITVGDPDRVEQVSLHFDSIELIKHKREFKTVTGRISDKRITVISTGIGTDNIDIVMNELDALVNIDLNKRVVHDTPTSLNFYRVGTSGSILPDLEIDSFLVSRYAIGLDGLMQYYHFTNPNAFTQFLNINSLNASLYLSESDEDLSNYFSNNGFLKGITLTAAGFYGPQNRELRLASNVGHQMSILEKFEYDKLGVTNLEMETAGIYGLGKLLGHKCVSLNAILANRKTGGFSNDPTMTVNRLIIQVLKLIVERG